MNLVKQREVLEAFAVVCETNDFSRISETWSQFFYDLEGARGVFVVDDPKYEKPLLPRDTSFAAKCSLVGLLKSQRLGLIQNAGSPRPFNYTWFVFADTNFVSYCNAVYSGRSLRANADAFYAAGDYLMTQRDALAPICYMIENFERRHLPQVRDSVKAFTAFKCADTEAFRSERVIRPRISEPDLDESANGALAFMETAGFKLLYERMRQNHLVSRIALTKMAAIDFDASGRQSPEQRLFRLLEYFDEDVAMLPQNELLAAWRYFEVRAQEPFFKMIQRNAKDLHGSIHSMAWDLAHWRNAFDLAMLFGHLGPDGKFPIPYFMTFDKVFAGLLFQLQLKGVIYLGSVRKYLPIHDMDWHRPFSNAIRGDAQRFTTDDAVTDRNRRLPTGDILRLHLEHLAEASGHELAAVIGEDDVRSGNKCGRSPC